MMKLQKIGRTRRGRSVVLSALAGVAIVTLAACAAGGGTPSEGDDRPDGVPTAGESPTLDRIYDRGSILAGASVNFPWLLKFEGEWAGGAWVLTQELADRLGVDIETVDVTNETKVQILVNGGVDITISPLAKNPEREKVIAFAPFGSGAYCAVGLGTNPVAAAVDSVEGLNDPSISIASYVGSNQATFVPKTFPEAESKEVTGSGSQPLSEVLAGRSDFVLADQGKFPSMKAEYPDLISVPADCVSSTLGQFEQTIGLPKDDKVFIDYVNGIADDIRPELEAEQTKWLKYGAENPTFTG